MTRLTLNHYDPAWHGDCVLGVLKSIEAGYAAQDVNGQCLAGGVFAAAHWGHVGPGGASNPWQGAGVKPGAGMSSITVEQWRQMLPYTSTARERPATLSDIIAAVVGKTFVPCFEIKPGVGTHTSAPYDEVMIAARTYRVPCIIMTIQSYGSTTIARATWESSAKLRMAAAKRAGLPTMLLWRHTIRSDSDWWPILDAVKGAPDAQVLPPGVVRVPNTATAEQALTVLGKVTAKAVWTQEPDMTTPLRVDGADLSHHQSGALDFAAFKVAGGRFVYHKATEGDTFTDDHYVQRMGEVKAAGLVFGAYHYAHPDTSSGTDQAARFLKVAKVLPGDMLPALDLETTGGLSQVNLTKWVGQFVGEVKRQLGALPIIYTNKNLASDFGCRLWVARYSNLNAAPIIPTPFTRISIRQFSNGVYGVPKSAAGLGNVDLDTLPDGVNLDVLLIPKPAPVEVPVVDDRYDRVTFRSVLVDKWTRCALEACEAALGYELTLMQGSFRPATTYSAGTHTGGGVIDLAPYDFANKVRVLREHGFAAWHRLPIPGLWGEHIHAVQFGNTTLAGDAVNQITDYQAGRDGLASHGPDNGPRIPLHAYPYTREEDMPLNADDLKKIEAIVQKYVGDVVPSPTTADPKNTVWVKTALAQLLKKTGA